MSLPLLEREGEQHRKGITSGRGYEIEWERLGEGFVEGERVREKMERERATEGGVTGVDGREEGGGSFVFSIFLGRCVGLKGEGC